MAEKTLHDLCIEMEILLDIFKDCRMKYCKSAFFNHKTTGSVVRLDDFYTHFTNGRTVIDGKTNLPRCLVFPIHDDMMNNLIDAIRNCCSAIYQELDETKFVTAIGDKEGKKERAQANGLMDQANRVINTYLERRNFIKAFWDHTKSKEEESANG